MSSALPSTAGLERADEAVLAALGEALRDAGLDRAYAASLWQGGRRVLSEGVQEPVVRWRARALDEPAAVAYRIFCLRDPVPAARTRELLGHALHEALLNAEVLVPCGEERVVSPFDLRFHDGFLVLCDDLGHGERAVFGNGTTALAALEPRTARVRAALDVGCGAGALSLSLARMAERVVATDVNPRVLPFVRANAAINGVANVDARIGDLFETVGGERFDLVVSQPPFVPRAAGARPLLYRLGGPRGPELALRIVCEVRHHLTDEGRAMVLFELPVPEGDGGLGLAIEAAPGFRILLLIGDEVPADAYSVRSAVAKIGRDARRFAQETARMRAHLDAAGIRGLSPVTCLVDADPGGPGRLEAVPVMNDLWGQVNAEAVGGLVDGLRLLDAQPDALAGARLRLPPASVVVRPAELVGTAEGGVVLGLPPGEIAPSLRLTALEWDVLRARSGAPGNGAVVGADPSAVEAAVTRLIRAGLLDRSSAP